MGKARRKNGFTLAEMLIVVGILGILMAFAFIGITGYLRSMTKLEYDGYAREIFVAAQNHLAVAENQGYYGLTTGGAFGTADETKQCSPSPELQAAMKKQQEKIESFRYSYRAWEINGEKGDPPRLKAYSDMAEKEQRFCRQAGARGFSVRIE